MKKSVSLFCLFLFVAGNALAQSDDLRKKEYNLERSGLALEGYDPVSYFTMSEPEKGRKEIALTHDGVVYWFATNENRDLFRADPEKYEPKHRGWCAYAMGAKGEKVEVDPETFKIIDGKLYLFYNKFFNNTLDSWNKDEPRLKSNADRNWSKIIQQGK